MAGARAEAYSALVDDTEDFEHKTPSNNASSEPSLAASPRSNRRAQVMTGPLPDDFLQMTSNDQHPIPMMQQQPMAFGGFHQSAVGVIHLTVVQARLAKNYGMTRMDPFCRIRLGVMVFETPTAYNGSKTPRWNKMIQSQLPPGITEFYIEIYDERTFQMDEKIAWGLIKIKPEVFEGETSDDWHPLNGKQGDGKEGMVQVIMQYKKGAAPMMMNPMIGGAPVLQQPHVYGGGMVYGVPPMMYQQPIVVPQQILRPQHPHPPQQPMQQPPHQTQQQFMQPHTPDSSIGQINEKDLKALKEMCPGLDDEIIRSVYQSSGENLDRAAAQLLEMSAS